MFKRILLIFLFTTTLAHAQVPNPTIVTFTVSSDHFTPILESYAVEIWDGEALIRTTNIGKPIPNIQNEISTSIVIGNLLINKVYQCYVSSVGLGQTIKSVTSASFIYTDSLSITINIRL